MKEASVLSDSKIEELIKISAAEPEQPESAVNAAKQAAVEDAAKKAAEAALAEDGSVRDAAAAAAAAADKVVKARGGDTVEAAYRALEATRDAGGDAAQQKEVAAQICGCMPELKNVIVVSVTSEILVAVSVPLSKVGQIREAIQTGASNSLGLAKKQVKVGTGSALPGRRLGDGCDNSMISVTIETRTGDINSQEVKQLKADVEAAMTSGQLMLNVKAAAAEQNVLTKCLKDQDVKLEAPEIKEETAQKEVIVSGQDDDLVITFNVRATSGESVERIESATSEANTGTFTKKLAEELQQLGETIDTEVLSAAVEAAVAKRIVDKKTSSPTKAPAGIPDAAKAITHAGGEAPPPPATKARCDDRCKTILAVSAAIVAAILALSSMIYSPIAVCGKRKKEAPTDNSLNGPVSFDGTESALN